MIDLSLAVAPRDNRALETINRQPLLPAFAQRATCWGVACYRAIELIVAFSSIAFSALFSRFPVLAGQNHSRMFEIRSKTVIATTTAIIVTADYDHHLFLMPVCCRIFIARKTTGHDSSSFFYLYCVGVLFVPVGMFFRHVLLSLAFRFVKESAKSTQSSPASMT